MTFPDNNLNQTAVYWGNPQNDGEGGYTYDDPVEIDCRWVEISEIKKDANGEEFMSKAEVQVKQDLVKNGILFLGDLDDLDSSQEEDPASVQDAFPIKIFEKVPTLKQTRYFRMAVL